MFTIILFHFYDIYAILILTQHNIYLLVNVTCSATAKQENPSAPPFTHHDLVHFNCNTLGVSIRVSAHAAMQKTVCI